MPEGYAAVDFGASTGRLLVGRYDGGRVELEELRRFPNHAVLLPDGLHWDLTHLFAETVRALESAGPLRGVGVDTWGVDYGLLDADGRLLGVPYHYRDGRSTPMVARAYERVPRAELYAATGIQELTFNTAFQLLADEGGAALAAASRIALIPDLLAFWLSGVLANERTAASTTGLLDPSSGEWAHPVIERLGLPGGLFGELVDPGTPLGPLRPEFGTATVHAVGGHDTASAFAAAPVLGEGCAILSSGTWSLLGLELDAPVLSEAAREADLTNERGVDGTTRLLKNVMGLWLEQECARTWGEDHAALFAAAAAEPPAGPVFDPDDPAFLAPGDIPARIAEACRATGQVVPRTHGALIRAILDSLACKYRYVLEALERVSGRSIERIHVIGGGVQVTELCRLTAELTGRPVHAGPVEATALGNVLVQLRSAGELASLTELRAVARASARSVVHEPSARRAAADRTYQRFLDVTGLPAPVPT